MANYYNEKTLEKFLLALRAAVNDVKFGRNLEVTISQGNRKMGDVASVSLLPFLSCPGICKDTCGPICYAAKIANLYKTVLNSYARNQAIAIFRPDVYWTAVDLAMKSHRFFRFHVSGDILNAAYFQKMIETCKNNPGCTALCFTKNYKIVNAWIDENGSLPENLKILFSGDVNLIPENPHGLPETVIIRKGTTAGKNVKVCRGNCFECALNGVGCWTATAGDCIGFNQH